MDGTPRHHLTLSRLVLALLLASAVARTQVRGDDPAIRERIEATRRVLREFTKDLPNFVCEQETRRFRGTGKVSEWRTLDRVTATMIYLRGEEHTTNIKIDGKPATGKGAFEKGVWGGGEYGPVQFHVLERATHARFTSMKNTTYAGRPALRFSYEVIDEASEWEIEFQGQRIKPAYHGRIWIDVATSRPLRIEMEAQGIHLLFPLKQVTKTVDYGLISVAGREVLLPVRSTNLVCHRVMAMCAQNETAFNNYRLFTADSVVTTTDSTVAFPPK
jgi:hypothetical protein